MYLTKAEIESSRSEDEDAGNTSVFVPSTAAVLTYLFLVII